MPQRPSTPAPLASVRAIAREVRAARRVGHPPSAIVLSPDLDRQLQDRGLSYLWSSPARNSLLGVAVEIDAGVHWWRLKVE